MRLFDLGHAALAFARTSWLAARLKTRDDVERYRAEKIAAMLQGPIRTSAFYRNGRYGTLADLPVMDKAAVLANFAALNEPGIGVERVRAALARGDDTIDGFAFGQSTGTSGNRGYYIISNAERFVWLGTILAKTLPEALWARHRVALALPGFSTLYQSANTGSRVQLSFYDLALGVDAWGDALAAFKPDTIVAPPKVLRLLAERGQLGVRNIFSGAEVLDPLDRAVIENATGAKVREIYMATEGLLGVGCPNGTLHLAEDAVAFEWEKANADSTLVTPLITDFTRQTQIMARYRMNDLLELSNAPCPCGSPLQAVARVEGRQDDVFSFPLPDGTLRMVTPDVLRNAVIDADARIQDFRIVQTGSASITVSLPMGLPNEVATRAEASLRALLQRQGLSHVSITMLEGIEVPFDRKLRRVRRAWHPDPR